MGPGPKGREELVVIETTIAEMRAASMGPGPKGREEPTRRRVRFTSGYGLQWGPALKAGRNPTVPTPCGRPGAYWLQWGPALKAGRNDCDMVDLCDRAIASMGPGPKGREEPRKVHNAFLRAAALQWGPALKAGRNPGVSATQAKKAALQWGPALKAGRNVRARKGEEIRTRQASMGPGPKGREEP